MILQAKALRYLRAWAPKTTKRVVRTTETKMPKRLAKEARVKEFASVD